MKNNKKNRDPERARKRAGADFNCAARKLGPEACLTRLAALFPLARTAEKPPRLIVRSFPREATTICNDYAHPAWLVYTWGLPDHFNGTPRLAGEAPKWGNYYLHTGASIDSDGRTVIVRHFEQEPGDLAPDATELVPENCSVCGIDGPLSYQPENVVSRAPAFWSCVDVLACQIRDELSDTLPERNVEAAWIAWEEDNPAPQHQPHDELDNPPARPGADA